MPTESVIDTLRLDIVVNNNGGTRTINSVSKSVKNLSQTLQHADLSKLVSLANTFQKFGGLGENVKGVSRLNTSLRTLNKNLANIDTAIFKSKFAEMTSAITPFIDKVNSAQASLQALQGVMGGAKTLTKSNKSSTPKSSGVGNKLNSALNIGSIVGKLYFAANATKRLGQTLAQVVQYGIDYEETLNLWQVAMRGNIAQARTFVSEMNRAYGLSEATLMNYQAVFRNMLSALGNIGEASSYAISESLTQMALDFSSLYNVSVESAMTKFQAVLSGQVRPIRTAGYDITEQTIFQLYQSLGGQKTVRQLNQTEKQLLRILAVFEQMKRSGAIGDLAKTLSSSANQLRMMKENGKEFATWVGISINHLLQESQILVTINAYLIALADTAKQIAVSLGYEAPDFGVEWEEGLEGVNKQVDELQGKLLGFDKFQVLNSAGNEEVGIEQTVLDALSKYESVLSNVENPAAEKAKEIAETLTEYVDKIKKYIEEIQPYIKSIGDKLSGIFENLKTTTEIFLPAIKSIISLVVKVVDIVLTGVKKASDYTQEDTKELLSIINHIVSIIEKILPFVEKLFSILGKTADVMSPILSFVDMILFWVDELITKLDEWGILEFISLLIAGLEFLFKILQSISAILDAIFNWNFDSLGTDLKEIWTKWDAFGDTKVAKIEAKAGGGLATKGSLFYAGEAGPELVTHTSGGNSTIMNMIQLEDAVARGFIRGFASTDSGYEDDNVTDVYVDGQRLFNIMRGTAKRNGYDFVKV